MEPQRRYLPAPKLSNLARWRDRHRFPSHRRFAHPCVSAALTPFTSGLLLFQPRTSPQTAMAHDVFISYSHQDKPTADAVCALLEANGVRCWIASRDIAPGAEWAESIIEAIGNSRVMVLLFTARSNASPQVRKEVERAVNKGVTLIPLRIEDVTPSRSLEYFLSTPHWLDALTPPLEKHVHRLAKRIVALLSEDGTTAPPPSSPSITTPAPRMRRLGRAAWVGIVVVVAGSGVLTVYLQRHPLRGSNSPSSVPAPAGMAAASTGSIPAHPTTGQAPTSGVRSG